MNAAVDFPDVQYAVIEGLQTETGHEHIIIAYPNEKSLRDAFAAPSIVASGFATRDEAVSAGGTFLAIAGADRRTTAGRTTGKTNRPQREVKCGEARGETKSVVRRPQRCLVRSCIHLVASAVVIFSSTNTVSAAIRMALGISV